MVGGIGYGGWALLQNVQRVEFAPSPQAPEALATLPEFDSLSRIARASVAPTPSIDAEALAAVYAAQEVVPPRFTPRDGPISALDPDRTGVYAASHSEAPDLAEVPDIDPPFVRALAQGAEPEVSDGERLEAKEEPARSGIRLLAEREAWVRIRDGAGRVVHEALMSSGQTWRVPDDAVGFDLRAGNAGGVMLEIDGVRYGPLGAEGAIVSGFSLDADSIRGALSRAEGRIAATSTFAQR
jgi:hypothetical protein